MTDPVDKFSERIAAARALPEAEGMKVYAEHLAGYEPPFSLGEIADRLRRRKASLANERAVREAKTQQGAVSVAAPAASAPPRDATRKALPLASTPAASRQSIDDLWAEIVATLNAEDQRGESKAAVATRVTKPDQWAEIVSDLNAQNAQSGSPT